MINIIPGLNATVSALNVERQRMEIIQNNIANAQTTKDLDGQPYQGQQVVFETVLSGKQGDPASNEGEVRIARIEKDVRPPRRIYNPGHPDADDKGFVSMPNINVHEELADMISASRAFEANLAVVRISKAMATQSMSIGKR